MNKVSQPPQGKQLTVNKIQTLKWKKSNFGNFASVILNISPASHYLNDFSDETNDDINKFDIFWYCIKKCVNV